MVVTTEKSQDRDSVVLDTIVQRFHAATAREAERGIALRAVYAAIQEVGTSRDMLAVLQRLERRGLVTWVAVLNGGYRVWPTPIAVRHGHRNTFRDTARSDRASRSR
jgi:hypothetical protein